MNETTTDRRHRIAGRFRSRRLRAALGLGLVLSLGVIGTQAAWTDQVTVTGSTFSTGKVDLKVNDGDTNVTVSTLSLAGMVPGTSAAGTMRVLNNGTVPLKYSAVGAATNADGKNLAGGLAMRVVYYGSVNGTAPNQTCGVSNALAGTATSLNGPVFGTSRRLNAGDSEVMCFEVTLPANAPSALQGATTTATFTFTGTSDLS